MIIHKIKEKILNLSLREKTLIIILIFLLLVFFTVNVVLPQYYSYKNLKKQIIINQEKMILINEQIAALPDEEITMKKNQEQWKSYEKYFPREINDGTILEIIGSIINSCNLRLISFTPQEPVVKDYYNELPVECVISGDISKLMVFVDQLEHQPNLIVIKNMVIENPFNKDGTNISKAKISLVMYSQKTK